MWTPLEEVKHTRNIFTANFTENCFEVRGDWRQGTVAWLFCWWSSCEGLEQDDPRQLHQPKLMRFSRCMRAETIQHSHHSSIAINKIYPIYCHLNIPIFSATAALGNMVSLPDSNQGNSIHFLVSFQIKFKNWHSFSSLWRWSFCVGYNTKIPMVTLQWAPASSLACQLCSNTRSISGTTVWLLETPCLI